MVGMVGCRVGRVAYLLLTCFCLPTRLSTCLPVLPYRAKHVCLLLGPTCPRWVTLGEVTMCDVGKRPTYAHGI